MEIEIGKNAAPFQLEDAQGNSHELTVDGTHWLLLIFHRHLG